jgi:hypothetical protein
MNIEPENKQKSDLPLGWKKAEIVASILASIALPLIVFFGGAWVNNSINERELRVNNSINERELRAKYIDIAAKVLQLDQLHDTMDQVSVRDWAFKVINKYSNDENKEVINLVDPAKNQSAEWFTNIEGIDEKTDFKVFLCESNWKDNTKKGGAKEVGNDLIRKMTNTYGINENGKRIYQMGWIKTDVWTDEDSKKELIENPSLKMNNESLKGKITILAKKDSDHYKVKSDRRIDSWVKAVNARLKNEKKTFELQQEIVNVKDANPIKIIICIP